MDLLIPILYGLEDGLESIVIEIIKKPNTRFEMIPRILKEAFCELDEICNDDKLRIERELKFTHRLKKSALEYAEHVRTGMIARLLAKR